MSSRRYRTARIRRKAFRRRQLRTQRGPRRTQVKVIVADDEMTIYLTDLPLEKKSTMNAGRERRAGSRFARLAFRYLIIPKRRGE